jgi:hypothetical protein
MPPRARHGDIGPLLVAARAQGVAWKDLMRHYGLGRARLAQIYAEALRRGDVYRRREPGPDESGAVILPPRERFAPGHEDRMSPKVPKPAPMSPPPTQEDPAVEEARRREIIQAQRARGRAATILTSGQGVAEDAPTARRMLMGG